MRLVHTLRGIALVLSLAAADLAGAQAAPALPVEAAAPVSRWQPEVERLDQSYRDRVANATDGRSQWIAGQLDPGDPVAETARYLRARSEVPAERLFLAALANACLEPVQPRPPACDATDRVADWATRDADNGMPSLLLAERARRRNNTASMIAYLDEAAVRTRFDDYWTRGAVVLWEDIAVSTAGADPASRAILAAGYMLLRGAIGGDLWRALCHEPAGGNESVRAACYSAGTALAERGNTWALRLAGARAAERNAATPGETANASARVVQLQQRAQACAAQADTLAAAFESADAAMRARALTAWERRLQRQGADGEVAACGNAG
ncbi:MAG: hypothetical protein ABIO63_02865 [Casimicrobiaceae bacterium]